MPALRTRDTQSQSRSTLEVSTDTLQPPALAIISPTPRAFTFPITHNLTDSPYSSPSHSPFEPDLRSLALTSTPPPFLTRTASPSPSPSSHRRRKSCSSDIGERRPRKGDEDYIKRPENAFILFRRKCCEDRQAAASDNDDGTTTTKKQRQADLSKTISQQWKSLSTQDRQYWENLAKEKKKEHEALYPNYVYRPQRARDKDGRPKARKNANIKSRRSGSDDDAEYSADSSLSFVVPAPRHHGRSASAPTPPPYQSIQVPNVYQMAPSCPTSPLLLPLISRRASHPDHLDVDDGVGMSFDFHPGPGEAYAHPHASSFDASLQSSEFLQGMFNMAGLPRDTLHPLSLSSPSTLSPSPSSSISSGPSSPLTPSSLLPQHDFSHSQPLPFSSSSMMSPLDPALDPSLDLDLDLDLQMEMQLQHEFAAFNWGPSPSSSTMSMSMSPSCMPMPMSMPMSMSTDGAAWAHPDLLLGTGDFDIGAIPAAGLDVSGVGVDPMSVMGNPNANSNADANAQSQSQSQSGSQETADFSASEQGIIAFDQMMAGHF